MSSSAAYMLIFRDTTPEVYADMSAEQRQTLLERWNGWCDEIEGAGRMQAGHPLHDGGMVVSAAGRRAMDGPFAEAKELVGGYLIVKGSEDEALAIADRCPLLEHGMTVEVRPVAPACHLALSLGWETMRGPEAGVSAGTAG